MGREAQWVEKPNGSRGTMKNEISLARILLATACPGSPALWAGSFTSHNLFLLVARKSKVAFLHEEASTRVGASWEATYWHVVMTPFRGFLYKIGV